ncbi:MAG: hypothetical protein J5940_04005 [Clostridia bacterium]|nr:hypothetical protein [Clostridia bacterium]
MNAICLIAAAAVLAAFALLDATVRKAFTAVLAALAFAAVTAALLLFEATVAEALLVVMTGALACLVFRLVFGRKKDK